MLLTQAWRHGLAALTMLCLCAVVVIGQTLEAETAGSLKVGIGQKAPTAPTIIALTGDVHAGAECARDVEVILCRHHPYYSESIGGAGKVLGRTKTDSEGRFSFAVKEQVAKAYLIVRKHGFPIESRTGIVLSQNVRNHIAIWLQPGREVSGQVIDAQGAPVAGVKLAAYRRNPWGSDRDQWLEATAVSEPDGSFTLRGIGAATRSICISKSGYAMQHQSRARGWGHEDQYVFRLTPGKSIRGRAVEAGTDRAILGGVVVAIAPGEFSPNGQKESICAFATTNAQGEFLFRDMPICEIALHMSTTRMVLEAQFGILHDEEGELQQSSQEIKLEIPPTVDIVGKVIDGDTGEPITSFTFGPAKGPSAGMDFALSSAKVENPDCRFSSDGLGSHSKYLIFRTPGYAEAVLGPVDPKASVSTKPWVVRLTRGGSASGTIVDSSGQPVAGGVVGLRRDGASKNLTMRGTAIESIAQSPTTKTDTEGRWLIRALTPDQWHLNVTHPGLVPLKQPVLEITEGETFESPPVVMVKGSAVTGRIRTKAGKHHADAMIVISALEEPYAKRATKTGRNGRFRLENLSPGKYEFQVFGREGVPGDPDGSPQAPLQITLLPGKTLDIRL